MQGGPRRRAFGFGSWDLGEHVVGGSWGQEHFSGLRHSEWGMSKWV